MDPTRLPQAPYGPRFGDGARQEPSMQRRTFLALASGGLLAAPLAAEAQQARKVWRIARLREEFLDAPPGQGPFYDRMRELGWVYGRDFIVEHRAFGDQLDRIPDLAAELIRSGADVFMVPGFGVALRVQQVTRTIPIVTTGSADLVEAGLATSLARPGGNVTGIQTLQKDVIGKQLSLLKEARPGLSRLAFLLDNPSGDEAQSRRNAASIGEAEASGKALGVGLQSVTVRRAKDFDAAFSAFRDQRAQGLLVMRSPFIFAHRKTVVALALKHRLPTISELPNVAREGGLMSYGFDGSETGRLLAETINKILRGAKAGEIPIQQVTMFRLIINLKTAKALGLTIPPSLLGRADEVIQ
jgi:putative ABC transport system substrate-binding protein